jgi:hypothetical protein
MVLVSGTKSSRSLRRDTRGAVSRVLATLLGVAAVFPVARSLWNSQETSLETTRQLGGAASESAALWAQRLSPEQLGQTAGEAAGAATDQVFEVPVVGDALRDELEGRAGVLAPFVNERGIAVQRVRDGVTDTVTHGASGEIPQAIDDASRLGEQVVPVVGGATERVLERVGEGDVGGAIDGILGDLFGR